MGAAPSPTVTTLLSEDGSGQLGWPTNGYDDPTVQMCLTINGVLFASFIIICGLIYHWSRPNTESAPSLHGAKDEKFQLQQSKALLAKSKTAGGGEDEEEECKS